MRDQEIRPILKEWIQREFAGQDVAFVEEPQTHGTRIDLLAITGTVHAYEIKGPRDTLDRVDFQVESYSLCLPSLIFVAATKHVAELMVRLPKWCGIVELDTSGLSPAFIHRRIAGLNPNWNPDKMVRMLSPWDIVDWLEQRGQAKGFRGKTSFRVLVPAMTSRVPALEIPLIVAALLKRREPGRAAARAEIREIRKREVARRRA